MEGKSMFGSFENATFTSCKNDKDRIMEHIYSLGLRNVCFLCGDTHCSDVSEYILNAGTNQIVRELRNSSISSPPRNNINDNPSRVNGSYVGGINNFGLVNVNGTYKNYTIHYSVYTINGVVYEYSWNQNYV